MEVELITISDRSYAHIMSILEKEVASPKMMVTSAEDVAKLSRIRGALRKAYNELAAAWLGLRSYEPFMKPYWDPEFIVVTTVIWGYYEPADIGRELPVIVWEGQKMCVNRLPGMVVVGPVTSGDDAIWYTGDGNFRVPMDQKDVMYGNLMTQLGLASPYPKEEST